MEATQTADPTPQSDGNPSGGQETQEGMPSCIFLLLQIN